MNRIKVLFVLPFAFSDSPQLAIDLIEYCIAETRRDPLCTLVKAQVRTAFEVAREGFALPVGSVMMAHNVGYRFHGTRRVPPWQLNPDKRLSGRRGSSDECL